MIPDRWTDGLEQLDDAVRNEIVHAQIVRADPVAVTEALDQVHKAARAALRDEGSFAHFL
jgi:hypothetical protein